MAKTDDVGGATAVSETLPSRILTRSGSSINPRADVWIWTDGPFDAYIDFRWYSGGFEKFVPALKSALLPFVKGYSSAYADNLDSAFRHFTRLVGRCPEGNISTADISNYGAKLLAQERWRIGTVSILFQKWVELGLPGVDADCAAFLVERRKPGNKKGEAVRTRDPVEGPLTEEEYTALYSAVNAAYGRNELPLWSLLLTRLLLACGGRISQYASLKVCDFDCQSFVLKLPQAKTREVHTRVEFIDFDISPQTGRLIVEYIGLLRQQGFDDASALFPNAIVMLDRRRPNRDPADLFFGHCSPEGLSQRFRNCLKGFAPPTSRLDFRPMPVSPKRFRYTFGTRLAEEGASRVHIANRLGHADLQHVEVYFAASPEIIKNIDEAMGALLIPLANAFKGQLVEDE